MKKPKKRQPTFKASEYNGYNNKFGFDRYKYLYFLMSVLWRVLSLNEDLLEDDTVFRHDGMLCYVDKKFGCYCEVIGSGWLNIHDRVLIHERKLKEYYTRKS